MKILHRYRESLKNRNYFTHRYDVSSHVYSKSNSIELHTDLANVEVRRIYMDAG